MAWLHVGGGDKISPSFLFYYLLPSLLWAVGSPSFLDMTSHVGMAGNAFNGSSSTLPNSLIWATTWTLFSDVIIKGDIRQISWIPSWARLLGMAWANEF